MQKMINRRAQITLVTPFRLITYIFIGIPPLNITIQRGDGHIPFFYNNFTKSIQIFL